MSLLTNALKALTPSLTTQTKLKGLFTLGLLAAATGGLGYAFGGLHALYWTLGINTTLSMATVWFSREITFFLQGVKPIAPGQLVEGFDLHNMVLELCRDPRINMSTIPQIGIVNSNVLNAFATGRSKNHAGIAVNTGLLKQARVYAPKTPFTAEDLVKAVLLHELGHIVNHDIGLSMSTNLLALALSQLSKRIYNNHFNIGTKHRQPPKPTSFVKAKGLETTKFHQNSSQDTNLKAKAKNNLLTPFIFVAGWTIPALTHFLKMFGSRTRETAADDMAYECGQGQPMQAALAMLKMGAFKSKHETFSQKELHALFRDLDSSFCCHSPLNELKDEKSTDNKDKGWARWGYDTFIALNSTHPPIDSRIQHLKDLETQSNRHRA